MMKKGNSLQIRITAHKANLRILVLILMTLIKLSFARIGNTT